MKFISTIFMLGLLQCSMFAQPTNGLIAYWNFDEGSGTLLQDSQNSNDGTIVGASWVPGVRGSALSFDGNDYVTIPDDASLRPGLMTLAAWVKTSQSSSVVFIGKNNWNLSAGEQYVLSMLSNQGNLSFKRNGNCVVNAGWTYTATTTSINDGNWHHLAGTWDGTEARIYLDGTLSATQNHPAGLIDNCTGGTLDFGRWYNLFPFYLIGEMDEVYLYDRALSASEVRQLANPQNNASVPTLSTWGLIVLGLMLACSGAVLIRRNQRRPGFSS